MCEKKFNLKNRINKIKKTGNTPLARIHYGICNSDNHIYIHGGLSSVSRGYNDLYEFDRMLYIFILYILYTLYYIHGICHIIC